MMERIYVETVRLLLEIAPHAFQPGCFAMKGGTALNLFVHEMPRFSVDIDLVYVDHSKERGEALAEISNALTATAQKLNRLGFDTRVAGTKAADESKLLIRRGDIVVKVEVNHVFRGTLLPVSHVGLSGTARGQFTLSSSLPILATPELYGSKLVAALDRQHPRDLFDIAVINEHAGLTPTAIDCFVGYLAGHNRPIHEVLFSRDQDITGAFTGEFQGMTKAPVALSELLEARARLRAELPDLLTDSHRRFLLSLAAAKPDWSLMPFPHLQELPAIRWKLINLEKLGKSSPARFREQTEELQRRFE
ncbi:MAG: nucleotidyl transferase AbiEii/AbiGii toxin family protein [Chthoniobacter sp.]|nr:nucleotidyl transferase AbiEii/AbiGii toxin family protein [Chthoniobacter sp.]